MVGAGLKVLRQVMRRVASGEKSHALEWGRGVLKALALRGALASLTLDDHPFHACLKELLLTAR